MRFLSRTPPAGHRRSRSSGFTIVEIAVAASVMILAITSAIIVLQSGFKALDTARKTTLAAQIIQSEMERIRMLSWTRVSALDSGVEIDLSEIFPKNTALEEKIFNQMDDTFSAIRTITPLVSSPNGLMEITVTVTWKGIDGVTHNRSTSTRYTQNGLYNYYYTLAP